MIDPKFRNINRLFVLLFKNSDNDPKRDSFLMVLHTTSEIKDFNALIGNKRFFDPPVKKKA